MDRAGACGRSGNEHLLMAGGSRSLSTKPVHTSLPMFPETLIMGPHYPSHLQAQGTSLSWAQLYTPFPFVTGQGRCGVRKWARL